MSETVHDSCGCVFCDMGLGYAIINGVETNYHIAGGDQIKCTRPTAKVLRFDRSAPLPPTPTDTGA